MKYHFFCLFFLLFSCNQSSEQSRQDTDQMRTEQDGEKFDSEGQGQDTEDDDKTKEIKDINVDILVNKQENPIEPNTKIAALNAVLSDGNSSDLKIDFQILNSDGTDYELFELNSSHIINSNEIDTNKSFTLKIKAQHGTNEFESTLTLSFAENTSEESEKSITFQVSSSVGEDNLIGSFEVVNANDIEYTFSLVDTEDKNDNALFKLVDDKLQSLETLTAKEFKVFVEAKSKTDEELKFTELISFSLDLSETVEKEIVNFMDKNWTYRDTRGNPLKVENILIRDKDNLNIIFNTLEEAKTECEILDNCAAVWTPAAGVNPIFGSERLSYGFFYLFKAGIEINTKDYDLKYILKRGTFHFLWTSSDVSMFPDKDGHAKVIKNDGNKRSFDSLEKAQDVCAELANCHRVWQVNEQYAAAGEGYLADKYYLFEAGVKPTPYAESSNIGKFYSKVVNLKSDPDNY
ncbi:MAG: hypothetical protein AB8G05_08025 [Oligoflexales bacterium]